MSGVIVLYYYSIEWQDQRIQRREVVHAHLVIIIAHLVIIILHVIKYYLMIRGILSIMDYRFGNNTSLKLARLRGRNVSSINV